MRLQRRSGVGLVLDLAKLKHRSGAWTDPLPVPEQEIYVEDEAPGFSLNDATEIALSRLGFEVVMPDPLPLPFSTADVIRKKARRVYITYARFLELGATPGCSACENDRSNHSAECIARFEAAYGGEREAPPTPALHRIPPTPSMPLPAVEEDRSGRFEVGLVFTRTLLRKQEVNMSYHQLGLAIHTLTSPKELLTSR